MGTIEHLTGLVMGHPVAAVGLLWVAISAMLVRTAYKWCALRNGR